MDGSICLLLGAAPPQSPKERKAAERQTKLKMKRTLLIILSVVVSLAFTACRQKTDGKAISPSGSSSASSVLSSSSSQVTSSSSSSVSSAVSRFAAPESDPRYVEAYQDYDNSDYEAAQKICGAAIAQDANCFWAYNVKGMSIYFATGTSWGNNSYELVCKSVEINPDYSYGYFNKAIMLKGRQQWDDAITCFNRVIELKPDDTWSYYGIATIYADTDRVTESLNYLQKAIALDPDGVKQAARTQSHFDKMRGNPQFQALVNP